MLARSRSGLKTLPIGRTAMVISKVELAGYLLLVLHFLQIMIRSGWAFCGRLQAAGVPVPGLAPGWMPGSPWQDLSDAQWREFRASMPLLAAVLAAFVAGSRAVQAWAPSRRTAYYIAFALVFLGVLHGACLAFVLALVLTNYAAAALLAGRRHGLAALWALNCAAFLAVRVFEGVPFRALGPALAPLDAHRGMLRWHIHYNLLLLRMLSFCSDLHWARTRRPPRTRLPSDTTPAPELSLRDRTELPLPAEHYSLASYLAYCLYPPLYIAGPTVTFNAFASQLAAPTAAVTPKHVALYALRAAGCWLALEWVTHTLWFNSVAAHKLWAKLAAAQGAELTPLDMSLVPWWIMLFVWLKFLVIWRFFRLWALADGVEVPENMTRCICNNYDVVGFWKNWHASYNLWLVRYMYIPLGGASWRAANAWPIFTFVAVWHDLEWRLLSWAWAMALLIAPEMLAKAAGRQPWCIADKGGRAFRYLCCLAAAFNILLLMAANMVGFVFGLDGIRPFLTQVLGQPQFLWLVLLAMFSGAQLMFALRDWEGARSAARETAASKA